MNDETKDGRTTRDQRTAAALAKADEDAALFALRDEGLTLQAIATRLGTSRQAVHLRLRKASARAAIREGLASPG